MKTRFSFIILILLIVFFVISCTKLSNKVPETDKNHNSDPFTLDQFPSEKKGESNEVPNSNCDALLISEEKFDISGKTIITPENASRIVELFRLDYPIDGERFAWSPDGKLFALSTRSIEKENGTENPSIIILNGTDFSVKKIIKIKYPQTVLSFSPDSKYLATTGDTLHFWDVYSCTEKEIPFASYGITALDFSPDGTMVAIGIDKNIQIWDLASEKELFRFIGFANDVTEIKYSRDNQYVMAVSYDKSFRVWNAKTGENIITQKYDDRLISLVSSPDGSTVALGGGWPGNVGVKIIDAQTFQLQQSLPNTYTTTGLAFSPNSSILVTTEEGEISELNVPEGEIILWKTQNYERIHEINGLIQRYPRLMFSPDGTLIATTINTSIADTKVVFFGIPDY